MNDPEEASRGYVLGAQLLDFLAPDCRQEKLVAPIASEVTERKVQDGVLDPAEIIAAVGTDPDGMKIAEVVRLIRDIAAEKELVGLTIAEPMPRAAIRLRQMLEQLPLIGS